MQMLQVVISISSVFISLSARENATEIKALLLVTKLQY